VTQFLASVTGPDEAAVALDGGADLIDLKNPTRGALGAADVAAVRALDGRRPVSAVTGDLPMDPATVLAAARAMAEAGADYIKIGIFPGGAPVACLRALAPLASRHRLIAVLFADLDPDLGLLPLLHTSGFAGAMLDTARKDGRRLLDAMDMTALAGFVAACRANGLSAGLAGRLEPPDVPRLLMLQPDVLGFRSALTSGARDAAIDAEAVRTIRELIPSAAPAEEGADWRLLAARGYAPDDVAADRVVVRDLVLPVSIGAYAYERAAPQRVRFNVEALLLPQRRPAHDMRDVFSYDIIIDGIHLLIAEGHVALVETLAERVAALVLAHPRVAKVTVRLEKLDTGSGIVGVEIVRRRGA
jgi:(5-formylfuran-3-yl)methyl phosphate synthase